jgi:predicted esterase
MKRSLLILLSLLFFADLQIFSQTICQNPKANSVAGETEKYVYKTYLDKKGNEKELHLALVRPVDNLPDKKRPLVIGLQGSGFLNTCFTEPCYIKYSENVLTRYFIPQGFVTASIQYRLNSPFDFQLLKVDDEKLRETHYKAVQDARQAIKYIFENAEKFGVDTNNVFIIGTSAGAITALHSVYLDDDEVPKDLSRKYGKLEKRENIKGVISLSGAIYDLSYLKGEEKMPLMIVHGKDDEIVPFDKGFYLKLKSLTPVFGGKAIYDEAIKRTIPTKGYFYEFGHAYPSRFQKDIYKNTNDFIRSYLSCR